MFTQPSPTFQDSLSFLEKIKGIHYHILGESFHINKISHHLSPSSRISRGFKYLFINWSKLNPKIIIKKLSRRGFSCQQCSFFFTILFKISITMYKGESFPNQVKTIKVISSKESLYINKFSNSSSFLTKSPLLYRKNMTFTTYQWRRIF